MGVDFVVRSVVAVLFVCVVAVVAVAFGGLWFMQSQGMQLREMQEQEIQAQEPIMAMAGVEVFELANEGYTGEEEAELGVEPELEEEEPFTPIFTSEPLPLHIIDFICGRTFKDYTPFGHYFLTYLTITFVDFDGNDRIGNMIVAAELGDEVLEIFQEIYESRFPIYSIKLIDYFDAIDYYSLAANNSSAFNFRYIAGTTRLSRHAYGKAIDINPIQNPYIRGGNIWPAAGEAYLDRSYIRPGMIISGCPVYTAFTSRGWTWGGHWTNPIDYHHFERRT